MKVTITIVDEPEDGPNQVTVSMEFDPPLTDDTKHTQASKAAIKFVELINKHTIRRS
jgi:hypothetical protein